MKAHDGKMFNVSVMREMKIRVLGRGHCTPARTTKIGHAGDGAREAGGCRHHQWGCPMVQPLWKMVQQFIITLSILLLYNPEVPTNMHGALARSGARGVETPA